MADQIVLPSQTIYVGNLNESVNKQELRRALYNFFSQYGPILDVVALKTQKMRGQAFVVFRDLKSATTAARTANGFTFHGRPLRVNFAKEKSHAAMKEDGTYARYQAEQRQKGKGSDFVPKAPRQKQAALLAAAPTAAAAAATAAATVPAPADAAVVEAEVPHTILFLENLPKETTQSMVAMLFQQLPGFVEVRMIPNRMDIAFVQYESIDAAMTAKGALQNFRVTPTNILKITYAKQ